MLVPDFGGARLVALAGRGRPREELDDTVSKESVPFSIELETIIGIGGIGSVGAKRPFFVVVAERELIEKSPLALGAEATRLMKREAD